MVLLLLWYYFSFVVIVVFQLCCCGDGCVDIVFDWLLTLLLFLIGCVKSDERQVGGVCFVTKGW